MSVYAKQKQTARYRKQAEIYQRGNRWRKGKIRGMELTDTDYCV